MLQKGRKSANKSAISLPGETDLAVFTGVTRRLEPPAHISEAERSVWLQVVNDQPASAFTESHFPLLEMYSRHVVISRKLAEQLAAVTDADLASSHGFWRFGQLTKMHERECRAASAFATRLRITRQSIDQTTLARVAAKHQASNQAKKPWETM